MSRELKVTLQKIYTHIYLIFVESQFIKIKLEQEDVRFTFKQGQKTISLKLECQRQYRSGKQGLTEKENNSQFTSRLA